MSTIQLNVIDRLFDPVVRCLTPEAADQILNFRPDAETVARVRDLADKANNGELTSQEQNEYEDYIEVIDLIGILQARTRAALARAGR